MARQWICEGKCSAGLLRNLAPRLVRCLSRTRFCKRSQRPCDPDCVWTVALHLCRWCEAIQARFRFKDAMTERSPTRSQTPAGINLSLGDVYHIIFRHQRKILLILGAGVIVALLL